MKTFKTLLSAAALVGAAGSIARAAEFEVLTFWTSPSEAAALAVVRDAFKADGHTWTQRDYQDSSSLRRETTSQFVTGTPSAAIQWTFGQSISEMADSGMMTPLADILDVGPYGDVLPPFVIQNISSGGEMYFAPVGVHVENMMWMSRAVLEDNGLSVPTTWTDLIAGGRLLKARGIMPIVLPRDDWTRAILLRAVIAEEASRFEPLRNPSLDWDTLVDHPAMERIAETLVALRDLVTPESEALSWTDAARELAEGRAAFYFMGDWVRGEFNGSRATVDQDILCAFPPGNAWVESLVIDGFYFPVLDDPKLVAEQGRLAKVLMDPKVQLEFALKKGAVPVRQDVDFKRLDSCAADAHARLSSPDVAFHRIEPLSPGWNGNVRYAVTLLESLSEPDMTVSDVMARLRAIRLDSPRP